MQTKSKVTWEASPLDFNKAKETTLQYIECHNQRRKETGYCGKLNISLHHFVHLVKKVSFPRPEKLEGNNSRQEHWIVVEKKYNVFFRLINQSDNDTSQQGYTLNDSQPR